jgi:hypothetical protein
MRKRIQLIHRTKDGKCEKFWQNIDFNQMITLEHVWNNINQQSALASLNNKYKFCYFKTKQVLPSWFHVDLLKDNDQILIDEVTERYLKEAKKLIGIVFSLLLFSVPSNQPIISSASAIKHISKKKQLQTCITNRSFIISNKYSIPNAFYEEWEEGKMHRNTNNCRMSF